MIAWLLRDRLFLDADQGFAGGAVQDVDPAGSTGFSDALAGLSVDHRVKQNNRACGVIIPHVVMHFLKVPRDCPNIGGIMPL
jgi:hypothetical protein